MKKKVQLSTVIKIKEFLEKLILSSQEYIRTYNDTEMKVDESLVGMEKAESELITIKEIIQEANKGKHEDGKTNNYYIYKLSNLNSAKRFYTELKTSDKSQLDKQKIDELISKIDKEINEIRKKLSDFNTKEVSIELNENLISLGIKI